jgi:hypothetical protein
MPPGLNFSQPPPPYAHAYHSRGFDRQTKWDLDRAIADLTKAIEVQLDRARPYSIRG